MKTSQEVYYICHLVLMYKCFNTKTPVLSIVERELAAKGFDDFAAKLEVAAAKGVPTVLKPSLIRECARLCRTNFGQDLIN